MNRPQTRRICCVSLELKVSVTQLNLRHTLPGCEAVTIRDGSTIFSSESDICRHQSSFILNRINVIMIIVMMLLLGLYVVNVTCRSS